MLTVYSNHHHRQVAYWADVPEEVRSTTFDYLTEDEGSARDFVHYRGTWYDLYDIPIAPDALKALGWDGFLPDSIGTGVAFRYFDEDGNETLSDDYVVAGYVVAS